MTIGSELDAALAALAPQPSPVPAPAFDPSGLQAQIDALTADMVTVKAALASGPQISPQDLLSMMQQMASDVATLSPTDLASLSVDLQAIQKVVNPIPDNPPGWMTIPPNFFTFTQGKAQSISLGQFASDPDGDALTLSIAGLLPKGITYNPATKAFDYDGVGLIGSASIVANADDGRP